MKLFVDGSLNTRTAWCCDPYPGSQSRGHLALPLPGADRPDRARPAHGITPAVHAIGDRPPPSRSTRSPGRVPRRIEHAQLLSPADVARFAELGVTASVQPAHQPDDRDVADH